MERSIEDLLKDLPPVIEYYSDIQKPFKEWANLKLMTYSDSFWYASYREIDYDGDREHIQVEGESLKEALINLREELDKFPTKHKAFMWVTDSEAERHKLKEQP